MADRDIEALESYQLIPRLLHDVHLVDASCQLLDHTYETPIVPLLERALGRPPNDLDSLSFVDAELLLEQPEFHFNLSVPLLKPEKMGNLMPKVRKLAAAGVPAFALDLSVLADTPPYGSHIWRPRTREDLAELRAAAGVPLWVYGVCSVADADIATEAGLEGLVVTSGAGHFLNGPAAAEIFPDIFDSVAGTISVYAGGPVRSGVDVFRYLAIGAEAVVVDSDRSLENLRAELEYAMRLTGCQTLADIGYEAVFAPLFGEAQ